MNEWIVVFEAAKFASLSEKSSTDTSKPIIDSNSEALSSSQSVSPEIKPLDSYNFVPKGDLKIKDVDDDEMLLFVSDEMDSGSASGSTISSDANIADSRSNDDNDTERVFDLDDTDSLRKGGTRPSDDKYAQ